MCGSVLKNELEYLKCVDVMKRDMLNMWMRINEGAWGCF